MTTIAEVAAPASTATLTAFSHRDVPWANLGAELEGGAVTALEAAQRGGLDFEIDLLPAGFYDPATRSWVRVPTRRAVRRRDNKVWMSYVSDDYVPVQYSEAFDFMDEVNPKYVAAGTLGQGRQAFIVTELPERSDLTLMLPDANGKRVPDTHKLYVIVRSSHDMSRALEVCVLCLRDKCMNALTLRSFTRGAKQRWSIRHVGTPLEKLREARTTLVNTDAYVEEFVRFAERLAEIDVEIAEAQRVLETVLPALPRRPRQISSIVEAWQDHNVNGFAHNGWGLTNAVSDYFEHGRADGVRTAESRFTSGLTGVTHKYSNRVAQLLVRR